MLTRPSSPGAADRYQSAAAMAQDLDRIVADPSRQRTADRYRGDRTQRPAPSSIPAGAATVPMASTALRRPGWVRWALVGQWGWSRWWRWRCGPVAAALANLAQVISAGQQQGMVDNSAEDLLLPGIEDLWLRPLAMAGRPVSEALVAECLAVTAGQPVAFLRKRHLLPMAALTAAQQCPRRRDGGNRLGVVAGRWPETRLWRSAVSSATSLDVTPR